MYMDRGTVVVEEDEQVYGEHLDTIDKKMRKVNVPYYDVFS